MATKRDNPTTGEDSLGKAVRRNMSAKRVGGLMKRAFGTLRKDGFEAMGREFTYRYNLATHKEVWHYRADIPLKKDLRAQQKKEFRVMPLVSVVVPLYNTSPLYLKEMVESVLAQSYKHWQLIMVDGSDRAHRDVGRAAAKYQQQDKRILYVKLYKNAGIADNTNIGIAEADGEYIALLDHDDVLQPNALYEVVRAINKTGAELLYSDEIVLDSTLKKLGEYHFKPNFGPDTLRGCNYITHLCAFSKQLLQRADGGERADYNGAQDYDLILRLSEQTSNIVHIPKVLYFWRRHENSTARDILQKPYAVQAGTKALQDHLERVGLVGEVFAQPGHAGAYRVEYAIQDTPVVSILIPNKDHVEDLARCLTSIYVFAGWPHFEVVVLDNNSEEEATQAYYEEAMQTYPGLRVVHYPDAFNFAAICNFGAQQATGDHLLFLNNDTQLLSRGFITEMLGYSQRPDVGAVGAMLYYPDNTVQHAGLFVGIGGTAGVSHKGHSRGDGGDLFRLSTVQNVSAVTGAALMIKADLYRQLGGMDEENFAVALNDVDLCLRLRQAGLWNVFTPFAEAYHYESKTRGYDTEGAAKRRFAGEAARFRKKYAELLKQGDPFYNPHLTLEHENFGLK